MLCIHCEMVYICIESVQQNNNLYSDKFLIKHKTEQIVIASYMSYFFQY